jgi:hypothetical protein
MLTWQAARAAITRAAITRAAVASVLLGFLLAGCSHVGSGAGAVGPGRDEATTAAAAASARIKGSVTEGAAAFCSFLVSVNGAANRAASQQQGVQLLASIVPRLRAQAVAAPAAVTSDFRIVVAAAEQAVAQGDLSPLASNSVATAGTRLTSYCHARS